MMNNPNNMSGRMHIFNIMHMADIGMNLALSTRSQIYCEWICVVST